MVTIPGTSPYEDSYVIKFPDGDVIFGKEYICNIFRPYNSFGT